MGLAPRGTGPLLRGPLIALELLGHFPLPAKAGGLEAHCPVGTARLAGPLTCPSSRCTFPPVWVVGWDRLLGGHSRMLVPGHRVAEWNGGQATLPRVQIDKNQPVE